jgi:peptidoglycan/LPS O-acetylase OafA/YrhL
LKNDTKASFRVDIQALRAVAVISVVLFHFWPSFLTGGFVGVDVFFVISGFLITSHILRDVELDRFSIIKFWARRARRLLPASFTTLAFVLLIIVCFIPISFWLQWLSEVISSVFYFENWKLAGDSVDYLALSNTASPTQHFWSLGVEEQFYLVWPILVAIALLITRTRSKSVSRKTVLAFLIAVTVISLAYGIYETAAEPAVAYFSTPVRAWEFGAGALIAFIPTLRGQLLKGVLTSVGFVLILVSAISFNTKLAFPGTAALVPVIGTALVIVGELTEGFIARMLAFKPIQRIGDYSYSIYLWHWPVLILAPFVLNLDTLSNRWKFVLLLVTFILAFSSARFIERPLMSNGWKPNLKPRWVFATILVCSTLISGSSYLALKQSLNPIDENIKVSNQLASTLPDCLGALSLLSSGDCVNPDLKGFYPSLDAAPTDAFFAKTKCKHLWGKEWKPVRCPIGVANGKVRIAMVGDSHIAHYTGAIKLLAKIHNWTVDVYAKGACPLTNATTIGNLVLDESCQKWIPAAAKDIIAGHYDLIMTSRESIDESTNPLTQAQKDQAIQGTVSMWQEILTSKSKLLVIKDNPRPIDSDLRCLALKSVAKCSNSKANAFKFDPQILAAKQLNSSSVYFVNFDKYFCPTNLCPPAIGHVVIYRDSNHLTNTYVETLSPMLEASILQSLKN